MLNQVNDNIFSVTEINKHVKNILEQKIPELFIKGEISNFVRHSSGHIYFTLKDKDSAIKCVFFRMNNKTLMFSPMNGDQVICQGKITVYEPAGNYQINIKSLYEAGLGELQIKFLELKKKLETAGIFSSTHKKAIPKYPESIGIITSQTGAALQDILNILKRRFPCKICLVPSIVQGNQAAQDMIASINYLNTINLVDVIILGRGGGSQEDLFCFNDENLAYAIFNSKIPIISAVGHETDFTISDFAADLRAPTPSAAAELAVPDRRDVLNTIISLQKYLYLSTHKYLNELKNNIHRNEKSLLSFSPVRSLQKYQQKLDDLSYKLLALIKDFSKKREKVEIVEENLKKNFKAKYDRIVSKYLSQLDFFSRDLEYSTKKYLQTKCNLLEINKNKLMHLSPYDALKRGYSIIMQNKKSISSINQIEKNKQLDLVLKDGYCQCRVLKLKNSDNISS